MPDQDSIRVTRFKQQAKTLLKDVKDGNADAIRRVEPYFANPATMTLQQAQLVIARENNFDSWKKLLDADKAPAAKKLLHCSFCGKNQDEVEKLIAGPGVFVCDECVGLCNDILDDVTKDAPGIPESGIELEAGKLRSAIAPYPPSTRFFVRVVQP